ncbi:Uncharacterized conserved protein YciI, contains a putative active-site phosphohistidine [Verrucomicrobium sp. GAS474]|uniref:YciI family protein n=1 Tax=Verrucomicrobium sp. GAS474 TaxID=1882831 RepID=UPI00087976EF|nr:YciI family protein [Verrucomicrobium sp. GAS474]SDU15487.1 Uncharacterized conserved protein YciI, contains a putative active-site phosphohistidine [Verrucomicrobium sp. GAS474]
MKHFLVELSYSATPETIAAHRPAHRAYLQTGFDKGILLYSGPQVAAAGGILLARAETLEELQAFCAGDPFAVEGISTQRFVEFNPVLRQDFMTGWIEGK